MPGYQRAYSPEHKAERFADLMETTDRLFRERGFHEVTMTAIAKELGWTRSNLSRDEAGEFYLALIYQACELNGHLHCTENQGEAMKEAGVTFASDGFVPTLARIVAAILTGARTR